MSVLGSLVLPPDATLTPVSELPALLREKEGWADEDFLLTRPGGRSTSSVVAADCAEFLRQFRTPRTVIDAVVTFASASGEDPRTTLEAVYPVVRRLVGSGILVVPGSEGESRPAARWAPGDVVLGYTVDEVIQVLDDTEVYRATAGDGASVALKVGRPGRSGGMAGLLPREAGLLRDIGGAGAPRLLAEEAVDGRHILVLEWCRGASAEAYARRARARPGLEGRGLLGALAVAIADAYAALHARGVVHGDVHGRNVIVDESGAARIVDFGVARRLSEPGSSRAGIGFYFEPELARAERDRRPAPPPTPAGEQYAVAALLYECFTGEHYADFGLERDVLLQQVMSELPRPFAQVGVPAWPTVEAVLARALQKDPAARFPDVAALSAALAEATAPLAHPAPDPRRAALEQALREVGPESEQVARGLAVPPRSSLFFGAAGLALFFLRLARGGRDAGAMLATADLWVTRARADLHLPDALVDPAWEDQVDTEAGGSPFHTASGVAVAEALVALASAEPMRLSRAVAALVSGPGFAAQAEGGSLDPTIGPAARLYGLAAVLEQLPPADPHRSLLEAAGDSLCADLWARLDGLPSIAEQRALVWLGAAHGWAGLLHATMRWTGARGGPDPAGLAGRLDQLLGLRLERPHGWAWPRASRGAPESWPGWCHGTAGFTQLWTLAAGRDPRFADAAERAGEETWASLDPGGNLCCGATGRGYAFLGLYRRTGDVRWLRRAESVADIAAQLGPPPGAPPQSLFKGTLGVALLAADLEHPLQSGIPLLDAM